MNQGVIRQGDLLFIPVDSLTEYFVENCKRADGVIAEGEATGHHHRVETLENAEVFRSHVDRFVRVGEHGVRIVHEEHAPVVLPPGIYKVNIAREFDYASRVVRMVRD